MHTQTPRIDWWNLAFTAFFIALAYVLYSLVVDLRGVPYRVSLWETIILSFAVFRLTRLVVYDSITAWVRAFFTDAAPFTFMGTAKTLINCPWCVGLWFALVVAAVYFAFPWLWFFIYVLALGGAASVLQLLANLIGWNAEYRKRRTNTLES